MWRRTSSTQSPVETPKPRWSGGNLSAQGSMSNVSRYEEMSRPEEDHTSVEMIQTINSSRQFYFYPQSVQQAAHQPKGVCVFSRKIHFEGLEESHPPQRHHAQVCTHQTSLGFIEHILYNLFYMQFFLTCFTQNIYVGENQVDYPFTLEIKSVSVENVVKCWIKRGEFSQDAVM